MPRKKTIIGIGEALLAELPDRTEPAGLAALIAINAARMGHEGAAISRLGQDATASDLLGQLDAGGIDTSHLQSDPDLATGRLLVRPLGATVKRSIDRWAAFDNLQWDFDLSDVAQGADAVVFGALAQRSSQTWSTTQRFLSECRGALRLMNLLNRPDDELDRAAVMSALNLSDAATLDEAAMHSVLPTACDAPAREKALQLMRESGLAFVVLLEEDGRPAVHTAESETQGTGTVNIAVDGALEAGIVGFLHGVLAGWGFAKALDLAARVAQHTAECGMEPIPDQWLTG
ncbi:MAG: hypothetical protein JSV91_08245 [Phycisphaerales bacterium]|nr:MAG: hypothetical protein JSV91_08245 [Phycisphaerales bacterium]